MVPTEPNSPVLFYQQLRLAGLVVWMILGAPILSSTTRKGILITRDHWLIWIALFCLFAPIFWLASSPKRISSRYRISGFLLQSLLILGMTYFFQDYFVGFLFVVVIWMIALYVPLQIAATWSVIQTVLLLALLEPHYHMGWRWAVTSAYVGFQFFALITANVAKREASARQEQDQINAQLLSTRELLAEGSRMAERMRITRDLHDVLGHHLAALAIQLEISANSSPEQRQESIGKAQVCCGRLLTELRQVVNEFRSVENLDLGRALSVLADNAPGIKLHLDLPENFGIADGARAHAILRCVQEATTNTIKHARATNLWITISVLDDVVEITARDDGRGSNGARPGAGLVGMRERLEQLGGGLNYELGRQSGFSLRAWLPNLRTVESA